MLPGIAVFVDGPLLPALAAMPDTGQAKRATWRRRQAHANTLPERFGDVLSAVAAFTRAVPSDVYADLNPAAIQRQIQALTSKLLEVTTSKAEAPKKPATRTQAPRASTNESTTPATRAS